MWSFMLSTMNEVLKWSINNELQIQFPLQDVQLNLNDRLTNLQIQLRPRCLCVFSVSGNLAWLI